MIKTDISGRNMEDITYLIEKSVLKKCIKIITNEKTTLIENYKNKKYFKLIGEIVLDTDEYNGKKKKDTILKIIPNITIEEFSNRNEWIYLFLINNRIVKIGGTRTGIKNRWLSYLSGHHTIERGKSGDCSKTNSFIYNTFEFYLHLDCKIEMYGYELPKKELEIELLDIKHMIIPQTYHAYESLFLQDYKKENGEFPILCNNGDPDYR